MGRRSTGITRSAVTVSLSQDGVVRNRGADLFDRLPTPGGACGNVSPPSVQVVDDEPSARVTASIGEPEAATDVPRDPVITCVLAETAYNPRFRSFPAGS